MAALVARLRSGPASLSRGAAALAGRVLHQVGRNFPGICGPLLISYGLGMIYRPLLFIAIGGFLLLADRRIP